MPDAVRESIAVALNGVVVIIVIVLLVGGTYFLGSAVWDTLRPPPLNVDPALRGLERLENLFSGDGHAMLGVGLYLGALVLIAVQGVFTIRGKLDRQAQLLEEQNTYLRYLATSARNRENRP